MTVTGQPPRAQAGTVEVPASLGARAAAVLIDGMILLAGLVAAAFVYLSVLASRGAIDLADPAAAQELSRRLTALPTWVGNLVVLGGLFLYYTVAEGAFGTTPGKSALHLRLATLDGRRPGLGAVVLRNLVRVGEAWLLYLPAVVTWFATPRRQRLGDLAAGTVVLQRVPAGLARMMGLGGAGVPPAPPSPPSPGRPATQPAAWPPPAPPGLAGGAGADLRLARQAAWERLLRLAGAHLVFWRLSEREVREGRETPGDDYARAWFRLREAAAAAAAARADLLAAARGRGLDLHQACADDPDLVELIARLDPYLVAADDEELHRAYLEVAAADAADLSHPAPQDGGAAAGQTGRGEESQT